MIDKDLAIKRQYIKSQYKGEAWAKKVDNMPKDQVIAIYYSIKGRRKAQKKYRKEKGNQISIFDYMGLRENEKCKIFNTPV